MAFYKLEQGQNEFLFQLANLEVREDFALWDNVSRVFLRQIYGVIHIDELKFMKADLFAQKYPSLRKVTQYIREILVDNQQYAFGFKKTANDQINAEISNLNKLNKDPLLYEFKYRKTGQGKETTHVVVVMAEVGKAVLSPLQPQTPAGVTLATPQQNIGLKLITGSQEPIVALDGEEHSVLGLFNQDNTFYSEQQFEQIFNATISKYYQRLLTPERLKLIYAKHYKQR